MDAMMTHQFQSSSVSLQHSVDMSDEEEEGDGAQGMELRFVTSEQEVGPFSDITALMLRYRHGYRRACMLLCVCGVVLFTIAFLLAFATFSGRDHCSQAGGQGEEAELKGGRSETPEGLYLGELRMMMRRLLQDEDIHRTVSRVSTAAHPPGSSEGTALASEILQSFRRLQMDHARGDYSRAAETLQRAIEYSDLHEPSTVRFYNTRIMKVEYYFLSQYVSVVETPFRHVIHVRGDHTLSALTQHLALLTSEPKHL